MSVALRLARRGKKKKPFYHVVATDSRNPRDGDFIEAIGAYDPNLEPEKIEFDHARLEHWLKVGATPSETVAGLIKRAAKTQAPALKS
jgi:small subunit ribosomal protein S16